MGLIPLIFRAGMGCTRHQTRRCKDIEVFDEESGAPR